MGTKVEMKNLNSFRVVEDAVAYEIERQSALLEKGDRVAQETRGWDEAKKQTFSQRSKEEAYDYRYFPEPDLPMIVLTKEHGFDTDALKKSLPELPHAKRERLAKTYKLTADFVEILVEEPLYAAFYEETARFLRGEKKSTALAANYLLNSLRSHVQDRGVSIDNVSATPEHFAAFIGLIADGTLSSVLARDVLRMMLETGKAPDTIMREGDFAQVSDEGELADIIRTVIAENAESVAAYNSGKTQILQFLVGQVMAKTKGKANPQIVQELLKKSLPES